MLGFDYPPWYRPTLRSILFPSHCLRLRHALSSFVPLQQLTVPTGNSSNVPEPRARHVVDLWRDNLIVYGGEGEGGGDGDNIVLLGDVWALNLTSYYDSGSEVSMPFPPL